MGRDAAEIRGRERRPRKRDEERGYRVYIIKQQSLQLILRCTTAYK